MIQSPIISKLRSYPVVAYVTFVVALYISMRYLFNYGDQTKISSFAYSKSGSSVDDDEVGSQAVAEPSSKQYHITHVFSSFKVPTSSPTFHEIRVVQESWIHAADNAAKNYGIQVEFLDASPDDDCDTPFFAKHVSLVHKLDDVFKGIMGTVGEVWKRAVDSSSADIIMISNSDIGTMPDFYVRVWRDMFKNQMPGDTDSIDRKALEIEANIKAINVAAKFLRTCMSKSSVFMTASHQALCKHDAKVLFEHAGGEPTIYDKHIARQVALKLISNTLSEKDSGKESAALSYEEAQSLYKSIIGEGNPQHWSSDSGSYDESSWKSKGIEKMEKNEQSEAFRKELESLLPSTIHEPLFLVTRLDLPVKPESNVTLEHVLEITPKKGIEHPGNDCFIMRKSTIPKSIQNFGHPQGVRPFGYWIPSEFRRRGSVVRRLFGRRTNPYTFHVGIGLWGGPEIPWRQRAAKRPRYTLFLAGNWFKLTEGGFGKEFTETHSLCRDPRAWRDDTFCESVDASYCRGITRLTCLDAQSIALRDYSWYMKMCAKLKSSAQKTFKSSTPPMLEPFCSYCNFLLDIESPLTRSKPGINQLKCIGGIPTECSMQNCIYLEPTPSVSGAEEQYKTIEQILDKLT